jgi:hypothetical protein
MISIVHGFGSWLRGISQILLNAYTKVLCWVIDGVLVMVVGLWG